MEMVKVQLKKTVKLMCLVLCFVGICVYFAVMRPQQWLDKVSMDLPHTINQLGQPSPYLVFEQKHCHSLLFITCNEMKQANIQVIYTWHKGLDVNIVAGFDDNGQLKYKKIVNNELLNLKE